MDFGEGKYAVCALDEPDAFLSNNCTFGNTKESLNTFS